MITNAITTTQKVIELFQKEFISIADRFFVYDLPLDEATNLQAEHIWKPGVYVFWHPKRGVIKVGRHLTNSRKRALEHIRDDTGGAMKELDKDAETRLLLFNVMKPEEFHWVAALEIFFEVNLNPEISSGRLG